MSRSTPYRYRLEIRGKHTWVVTATEIALLNRGAARGSAGSSSPLRIQHSAEPLPRFDPVAKFPLSSLEFFQTLGPMVWRRCLAVPYRFRTPLLGCDQNFRNEDDALVLGTSVKRLHQALHPLDASL